LRKKPHNFLTVEQRFERAALAKTFNPQGFKALLTNSVAQLMARVSELKSLWDKE
jgi:hypothetical protein